MPFDKFRKLIITQEADRSELRKEVQTLKSANDDLQKEKGKLSSEVGTLQSANRTLTSANDALGKEKEELLAELRVSRNANRIPTQEVPQPKTSSITNPPGKAMPENKRASEAPQVDKGTASTTIARPCGTGGSTQHSPLENVQHLVHRIQGFYVDAVGSKQTVAGKNFPISLAKFRNDLTVYQPCNKVKVTDDTRHCLSTMANRGWGGGILYFETEDACFTCSSYRRVCAYFNDGTIWVRPLVIFRRRGKPTNLKFWVLPKEDDEMFSLPWELPPVSHRKKRYRATVEDAEEED